MNETRFEIPHNLRPFEDDILTFHERIGIVSTELITRWLNQFKDNEIRYVAPLLRRYQFIDVSQIKDKCKKIEFYLKDKDVKNAIFAPFGPIAKSGALVAYHYRLATGLPEKYFVSSQSLFNLDLSNINSIVFLDDFIGTGDQAVEFFEDIISAISNQKLYYCCF